MDDNLYNMLIINTIPQIRPLLRQGIVNIMRISKKFRFFYVLETKSNVTNHFLTFSKSEEIELETFGDLFLSFPIFDFSNY